jgi:serine/threonine-protein kinase
MSNPAAKDRAPNVKGVTPGAPGDAERPLYDREEIARVLAEREAWTREELAEALARLPRRLERFQTDSGIPIPDVIDPSTVRVPDYSRDVGWPGRYPFTRGPQPTMYRGRLWTMRQFAGFGTPEDTNARFRYLLQHGVTGLSTAFDMPALMGYDADHPMSRGEVGKEGVAISTLRDFELLFHGIPLADVTTSMTINATAPIALAMYVDAEQYATTPIVFFVVSPSWIAIWMIVYSIVVPAPPGRALFALLASASAPAVLMWTALQRAGLLHVFTPETFFFAHVFPYIICVILAYVSARIMVTLGADVSRARELGSYRLIERIGQGGMGEVWRASHQLLAREAAIKFIRPESILGTSAEASSTMLRRFELKARATASLNSAHTVELYDFGVSDDGTFYYIMELLQGLDCDRLVREFGALPASRVVHLMDQVCESLAEAHEKGLIHRDVKPANIHVCRSGVRCDFVKVLDFGLVAHRQHVPSDVMLTPPEHAIGTPAFMAPEVVQGKEIDERSDLYGLGCVAYWLVTGRQVFEGSGFLEVISKHLQAEPDPPSRHCPGEVPRELDALILSCLQKAPELRPPNAREVARLLHAVPLQDSWSAERAEAWWSEHIPVGPTTGTS